MKKLGSELELKDEENKASTLSARITFFELILMKKPEVVTDLLRLFNLDCLPSKWKNSHSRLSFCTGFFLFHIQNLHINIETLLSKLNFKPEVWDTTLFSYSDFIIKNQEEFNDLLFEAEKEWLEIMPNPDRDLITSSALAKLIPNWKILHTKKNSEKLISNLSEWAEKWNLTNDWCLDFALECLGNCKIRFIDKIQFSEDWFTNKEIDLTKEFDNYIEKGSAWNRSLMKFVRQLDNKDKVILDKIPNYPRFNYMWEGSNSFPSGTFEVNGLYNPFNMYRHEFQGDMEDQFLSELFKFYSGKHFLYNQGLSGLIKSLRDFQNIVEAHISMIDQSVAPFAEKSISKKEIGKHCKWLVEFHIHPTKSFTELSKQNLVSRRSTESAIKELYSLLGLTPRKILKGGRPKGSKDRIKRRRLNKSKI